MILKIKDALDTVKPDDRLISETVLLLQSKTQYEKSGITMMPSFKKFALAACLFLTIGTLSISAYSYYQTPVNYLDIDINPSLELGINRFERVVEVNYFNEDAENLIEERNLRGCKPEEAVSIVLDAANSSGYISEGVPSVVSLAAMGSKAGSSDIILETCTAVIKSNYEDVAVYSSTISSEMKKEADSALISAGKLNLIKMVQSLDETATLEDYRNESVTNIFAKLNSLASPSNKEAPEIKKNSVLTGIDDVNKQIRIIENKLSKDGKSPNPPQHDEAEDNDEKYPDKKAGSQTGTKNQSANTDSKKDDSKTPVIPQTPKEDFDSQANNLPASGQAPPDEKEKPEPPQQNKNSTETEDKPVADTTEKD